MTSHGAFYLLPAGLRIHLLTKLHETIFAVQFAYNWFYRVLPVKKVNTDQELFLLNDNEIKLIRQKEHFAVWAAAFFGAMGVILLYLPQYVAPHWFPVTPLTLFGKTFQLPIIAILYSVMLVYIEILLLTFLNIYCIHAIAVATGFLNQVNKKDKEKRRLMMNVGLEKKDKSLLQYGIDPLQGLNKKGLLIWNFLLTLKATLSNMLFKFIIQRLLGRYAIRAVQDFAGVPIFAAWNAWGTRTVLRQARVVIMGQNLVIMLGRRIRTDQEPSAEFKDLLYDTLQYIAVSKRDFHQNHSVLTKKLFDIYNIAPRENHWLEDGYLEKLKAAPQAQREVCLLLIIVGFILDGNISIRERLKINELQREKLLDLKDKEILRYHKDFLTGKGIEGLIAKYI